MMVDEPLLSVIIPVFNTEQYLIRCVNSVKLQTYRNVEIVIVNDNSSNECPEEIRLDKNIVFVHHSKNEGLYLSRIDGFKASHGDYVAFLDSDDYVSPDYYRSLINSAQLLDLDIVAGLTIFEDNNGKMTVRNNHEESFGNKVIKNEFVRDSYYSIHGLCFAWHTIWNKVYKRTLWEACMPFFDSIKEHIVMTEDILFSSILFYNANSFYYVKNEGIHYCENKNSSTYSKNIDFEKYQKNMKDITIVFDTVGRYLTCNHAESHIIDNFRLFREYYSRMWRSFQIHKFKNTYYGVESKNMIDHFLPGYYKLSDEYDHYFERLITTYNPTNEKIKNIIIDSKVKVVSFDIFDTILCRNVLFPETIFDVLEHSFNKITSSNISFKQIRLSAEYELRSEWGVQNKTEDFSIYDIYKYIEEKYGLDKKITDEMCDMEIYVEMNSLCLRKSIFDLYNLCIYLGKKIVFTSDMYLSTDIVKKMLFKFNISKYDELLVSSDVGVTKYSGNIYNLIVSRMNVHPNEIVHIGDNWQSDYVIPMKKGIIAIFYPKGYEVYKGKIGGVITNRLGYLNIPSNNIFTKENYVEMDPRYQEMQSLIVRKFFDDGYPSFNEKSDFNGSPELLGYSVVGPHLLDICSWINEIKEAEGIIDVVFLSRDGYLIKKAFDILCDNRVKTHYVKCSRRSLLPFMISSAMDLLNLPVEYRNHSPKSIVEILEFCLKDGAFNEYKNTTSKFKKHQDYIAFIKKISDKYYDSSKIEMKQKLVSEYYRNMIPENSIVFDLGYSGKLPAALKSALGYNVTFLYVYKNENKCTLNEQNSGIIIKTLYNFEPWISGIFREYILSDYSKTMCMDIVKRDNRITDVCNDVSIDIVNTYAISKIQNSALEFIDDYRIQHPKCMCYQFKHPNLSLPFETMISTISDFDRNIFFNSRSDDIIYGGCEDISIYRLWTNEFQVHYSTNHVIISNGSEYSHTGDKKFRYEIINRIYDVLCKVLRMVDSKLHILR